MKRFVIIAALLAGLAGMGLCAPVAACPTDDDSVDVSVAVGEGWSCQLGDKLFSQFAASDNIGATAYLHFSMNASVIPSEYSVSVHRFPGGWGEGTYWLQYVLQVTDPQWYIVGVRLDATTDSASTVATKQLTTEGPGYLLTSVGGIPDTKWFYQDGAQGFFVYDTWTVPASSRVSSVSNTFYQVVPEPASLALLGVGLLAIGLLRRRKK